MKKMFIYFSTGALTMLFACNEKKVSTNDVPQAAQNGFTTKYPGATAVEWEIETENGMKVYEAEFKQDGKKIEAEFDSTGKFIKEE